MGGRDIDKAYEYFDNFKNIHAVKPDIITMENGFGAVTTAAYRLIGAYKNNGRINEANALMQFLENNYCSRAIYKKGHILF